MLEIKSCCKAFENQTVLQDVSLNIPAGSIIGVSGASGIGKSTLAKILCGVMPPDAGEVFLDGQLLVSEKSNYDRRRGRKKFRTTTSRKHTSASSIFFL